MASIRQAINKVSRAMGYDGPTPRSIAGAVTALGSVLTGGGGGGGAGLCCHLNTQTLALDHTAGEILAAVRAGGAVWMEVEAEDVIDTDPLTAYNYNETGGHSFFFGRSDDNADPFIAATLADYPAIPVEPSPEPIDPN